MASKLNGNIMSSTAVSKLLHWPSRNTRGLGSLIYFRKFGSNHGPLRFHSSNFPSLFQRICNRSFHTSQNLEATHLVKMPALSPTMAEGTIVKWCKKEGDSIAPGDVLCEIQTDKAVMEMECDEDGVLAKIIVPESSQDVKVGALIALTVDEGDDWKSVEVPAQTGTVAPSSPAPASASSVKPAAVKESTPPAPAPSLPLSSSPGPNDSYRLLGPAVKNYLKHYGISSSSVSGTGPHGVVTKGDVLSHVLSTKTDPASQGASAQASAESVSGKSKPKKEFSKPATYKDLEISSMRKTIAKRLLQSKSTIPHAYGTVHCNMTNLVAFRKKLASARLKVSVNDIMIKCVANALKKCPAINVTWEEDELKQHRQVDISVAVATPNGLITPIVTNVGNRDVVSIAKVVRTLAGKAKEGKLQPNEFIGGSFSISNLGMFGIHSFSAIINPPQCAILAVGGTALEIDEAGKPLPISILTLSYDASAIMEDDALKFLAVLKDEVDNVDGSPMGINSLAAAILANKIFSFGNIPLIKTTSTAC